MPDAPPQPAPPKPPAQAAQPPAKPPAPRGTPGADPSIQHAGSFWEQGDYRAMTLGDPNKAEAFAALHAYARPLISRPDLYFPELDKLAEMLGNVWSSYGGDEKRARVEAIRAAKTATSITNQEAQQGA